jgi:dTDP-4-amino-4,6-dideoxygalactose transaminase
MYRIPFNKPLIMGDEPKHINKVIENVKFSGNGEFTQKDSDILERMIGSRKAIMTSSGTDALEMAALLCNIQPGDEIILPSFTFVTTASAFALRGAELVWCDIREDTKNIDETKIESLITPKTKAVVVVHYGGTACQMDIISEICKSRRLYLVEDAAHAIGSSYKGLPLGSFGDLAVFSFHETKNIQCGEGGALLVNNSTMVERAQFIRDKGTNRIHFNQGLVDKYTWIELGSSFLMSELQAAFLYPQLLSITDISQNRLRTWDLYHRRLANHLPEEKLPPIPSDAECNGHLFYILLDDTKQRQDLIEYLKDRGILAIFHYVPLHKAPFWGEKYKHISLPVTERVSETLLRLPLYYAMSEKDAELVSEHVIRFLGQRHT